MALVLHWLCVKELNIPTSIIAHHNNYCTTRRWLLTGFHQLAKACKNEDVTSDVFHLHLIFRSKFSSRPFLTRKIFPAGEGLVYLFKINKPGICGVLVNAFIYFVGFWSMLRGVLYWAGTRKTQFWQPSLFQPIFVIISKIGVNCDNPEFDVAETLESVSKSKVKK